QGFPFLHGQINAVDRFHLASSTREKAASHGKVLFQVANFEQTHKKSGLKQSAIGKAIAIRHQAIGSSARLFHYYCLLPPIRSRKIARHPVIFLLFKELRLGLGTDSCRFEATVTEATPAGQI